MPAIKRTTAENEKMKVTIEMVKDIAQGATFSEAGRYYNFTSGSVLDRMLAFRETVLKSWRWGQFESVRTAMDKPLRLIREENYDLLGQSAELLERELRDGYTSGWNVAPNVLHSPPRTSYREKKVNWTPEMDEILGTMSDRSAARQLGMTASTAFRRRAELNIPVFPEKKGLRKEASETTGGIKNKVITKPMVAAADEKERMKVIVEMVNEVAKGTTYSKVGRARGMTCTVVLDRVLEFRRAVLEDKRWGRFPEVREALGKRLQKVRDEHYELLGQAAELLQKELTAGDVMGWKKRPCKIDSVRRTVLPKNLISWTPEAEAMLGKDTDEAVSKKLGISKSAIFRRRKELVVKEHPDVRIVGRPPKELPVVLNTKRVRATSAVTKREAGLRQPSKTTVSASVFPWDRLCRAI